MVVSREQQVFEGGDVGVVGEEGDEGAEAPFFIWTAVDMTSSAPRARARSVTWARTCGLRSSMAVSRMATEPCALSEAFADA